MVYGPRRFGGTEVGIQRRKRASERAHAPDGALACPVTYGHSSAPWYLTIGNPPKIAQRRLDDRTAEQNESIWAEEAERRDGEPASADRTAADVFAELRRRLT